MATHLRVDHGDPVRMAGGDSSGTASGDIESESWQQAVHKIKFDVLRKLMEFDGERASVAARFLEHVVELHDPDAVASFLRWKEDPVLDTILLLASKLDEEDRYEILDHAEELASCAGMLPSGGPDCEEGNEAAAAPTSTA